MRYLLIFFILSLGSLVHAQLASYDLNSNSNDQLNGYHPTATYGAPDFSSDEYMMLDSGEYLVLPNALNMAFDNTESLEIHVRFKVEGDWEGTPALDGFGEEARIILTTKEEYDERVGGFDVAARQWENALWLIVIYGDGINYDFGWSKGKGDFVSELETGVWYDVNIKFVFDDVQPYIQYIVNGTVSIAYYPDRTEDEFAMDYEGFRQTITQQEIVVGSTLNNTIAERDGEHPSLDLFIDSLAFASPALPGNPDEVNDVLLALIDHMNGSVSYTDTELEALQSTFVFQLG